MSKKAYRPGSSPAPQYPRLVEVSRRSVLDWGLIAVGSLWLGNAGCDRTPLVGSAEAKGTEKGASKEMGLRGKMAIARIPDAGIADAQATQAKKPAASTAKEPPLPPPGVPPQPRLEESAKQPKPAQAPQSNIVPGAKEPTRERMIMKGRPVQPRLQDVVAPEQPAPKPEAQKAEKKAKKKAEKQAKTKAEKASKPED
ncbi:MAG TPA: hypothetical protein VF550_05115 [Polyangia bacterium]